MTCCRICSKNNSISDYYRIEPNSTCCSTYGRTLCNYLLWICCSPCKCIFGNETINEIMINNCCICCNCNQTYLPMDITQNWQEYKQMLQNIQYHQKSCCTSFNLDINPYKITKENNHDLYMALIIVHNFTNNLPLNINTKQGFNSLIRHYKTSHRIENAVVTKELERDKKQSFKVKKVLLLGAEGSGKSTIFKQFDRSYRYQSFNFQERKAFIVHIHKQCITQMQIALQALETYQNENDAKKDDIIELSDIGLQAKTLIMNIHSTYRLDDEIVAALKCLWSEPAIQTIYAMRNITKIEDSSAYFWNKLDVLNSTEYIPNESDILLVRCHNKGITERVYEMPDGKGLLSVIDVGGQKSERKKWIKCFDNVTAVIFVASLSCYDGSRMSDSDLNALLTGYIDIVYDVYNVPNELILLIKQFVDMSDIGNAMTEQLELFDYICNCEPLQDTSMLLFLNKKDLFSDKIQTIPLQKCPSFASYSGDHSFDDTTKYIRKAFTSLNNKPNRKNIFTHIVCASDQDGFTKIFADVQHIVIESSLIQAGLMEWDDNQRYNNIGPVVADDYYDPKLAAHVRLSFSENKT